MPNDLHIHIPEGFSGTMTVSKDGQVTVTSAAPTAPATASEWPTLSPQLAADLEEMLKRQKDFTPATRSRDITAKLLERGWTIYSVNLKGAYVLFKFAGKAHAVSLYLNSLDLNNTKQAHRDFMKSLPGADVHGPDVRVPFNGTNYEQALDNIAAIEKWATNG